MKSNLHYYDNGVDGTTIVFVHGNTCSGEYFKPQLDDPFLSENYRLVTVDLPGHGKSPRLEDKTGYSLKGFAGTLTQFVNQLEADKIVLAGHSLGGHVSIQAAPEIKGLAGLVVWGTPPLGNPPDVPAAFTDNPLLGMYFAEEWQEDLKRQLFEANHFAPELAITLDKAYRESDRGFRVAFGASIGDLSSFDDELKIVKALDVPLAIFHAEKDPFVKREYLEKLKAPTLWKQKITVLEGLAHYAHLERPQRFNEMLGLFCREVLG